MDGPIFVVSSMRAGSTLLRLLLDSHPDIAIGPETGFMRAVAATREVPGFPGGRAWYRRHGITDDDLDARLREFWDGLFRTGAEAAGKHRWGEKTPFHIWHVGDMARIFPDAAFIGIVRNPGAVVESLRRWRFTDEEAADHWLAHTGEVLRQGAALGPRFALVRYEDLVSDPKTVMAALLGWLGEPWSERVLDHAGVAAERGDVRVEGGTIASHPIDPTRAGSWTATQSAEARAAVDRVCGPVRVVLGYGGDASPPSPLGDEPFLTGEAVARLLAAHPEARLGARVDVAEENIDELRLELQRARRELRLLQERRAVRLADRIAAMRRDVRRRLRRARRAR